MSALLNSEFIDISSYSYSGPDDVDIATINWYKKTNKINQFIYGKFIDPSIAEKILDDCCREVTLGIHTLEKQLQNYNEDCQAILQDSFFTEEDCNKVVNQASKKLHEKRVFIEKTMAEHINTLHQMIDESAKCTGKKYAAKFDFLKSNLVTAIKEKLHSSDHCMQMLCENLPKYFNVPNNSQINEFNQKQGDMVSETSSFEKLNEAQMLSTLIPLTNLADNYRIANEQYDMLFSLMRLR